VRFSILGVQFDSAATGNNQTDSIRVYRAVHPDILVRSPRTAR
jgi:hypothetical protein